MMAAPDRLSRLFIEQHQEGVMVCDARHQVVSVNEALARLLGCAPAALLGVDVLAPGEHALSLVRAPYLAALSTGLARDWTHGPDLGGRVVPLFEGGACAGVACTFRARNAEDRLRESLEQREQLLRTIIDEFPDPLVIKDQHGNFLLGNRTVARLYNTTPRRWSAGKTAPSVCRARWPTSSDRTC